MDAIGKGCEEITQKRKEMHDSFSQRLEEYKRLLLETKSRISKEPDKVQHHLESFKENSKTLDTSRVYKEYQNSLSKLGKEIDRRFKHNLSVIYNTDAFAGKEHLIRRAIAMHFIREGHFDLCDSFVQETPQGEREELKSIVDQLKADFHQMYAIINELKEHNLDGAIDWARTHRTVLLKCGSALEFNLHRLYFIQLVHQQKRMDAIAYARQHFGIFGDRYLTEIKRLMTATIYPDLTLSPYADFCSQSMWVDIRQDFQREFCSMLHMSAESPLYTSVMVGTTALPVFLKLHKIMNDKRAEWSQQDELAVEIPLCDDLRYHSVFICPVSKERASDTNPPMMMPCGHVVCKESLLRLSRSNRYGRNSLRFKCPYCPSESTFEQAQQVFF